jgi:hypothetical protein
MPTTAEAAFAGVVATDDSTTPKMAMTVRFIVRAPLFRRGLICAKTYDNRAHTS